MSHRSDVGYWIRVEDTDSGHGGHLFLYLPAEESALVAKTVIGGIRSFRPAPDIRKKVRITDQQVTDLGRFRRDHPLPDRQRVYELPVAAFWERSAGAFKEALFRSGVENVVIQNGDFFPSGRLNAVATGSDFFGRQAECRNIVNNMQKAQNILLCGPRRYGKTSLMRRVHALAEAGGFTAVMADLEAIQTPAEFVARMAVAVRHPGLSAMEAEDRKEELSETLTQTWQREGEALFRSLADGDNPRVFILDEYPFMLDSFLGLTREQDRRQIGETERRAVSAFVRWFRQQRQACAETCRFLLTGSIHPRAYLRDNRLDADGFEDCRQVTLKPFDAAQTRLYIESLLLGREIVPDPDVIDGLVRLLVPGIPYFIQIAMDHVVSHCQQTGSISPAQIEAIYHEKIIGPDGRRSFDGFERHFKRYLERKAGARAILDALATAGADGIPKPRLKAQYRAAGGRASDLDTVLQFLEYDFYVEKIPSTPRYRFASPILRDYWRRNQRQG